MTETQRAAMLMALEALEYGQHSLKQVSEYQWESRGELAMQALRAALADPEPEPVAWADKISFENAMKNGKGHDVWPKAGDYETRTGRALIGIYTTPPTRRPLTSHKDRPDQKATYVEGYGYVDTRAVRAIERAHGIGGNDE